MATPLNFSTIAATFGSPEAITLAGSAMKSRVPCSAGALDDALQVGPDRVAPAEGVATAALLREERLSVLHLIGDGRPREAESCKSKEKQRKEPLRPGSSRSDGLHRTRGEGRPHMHASTLVTERYGQLINFAQSAEAPSNASFVRKGT